MEVEGNNDILHFEEYFSDSEDNFVAAEYPVVMMDEDQQDDDEDLELEEEAEDWWIENMFLLLM